MTLLQSGYLAGSPLLSLLEGRCMTLFHNLMVVPAQDGAHSHHSLAFDVNIKCVFLATLALHALSLF